MKNTKWIAVFLLAISTSGVCVAAIVTQVITAEYGVDWADASLWSDGQTPNATNDYVNNGPLLRASTPLFGGKSLTFTGGGRLTLKVEGMTATIENLTLDNGLIYNGIGGEVNLAGELMIASGDLTFYTADEPRHITIHSLVSGSGDIKMGLNAGDEMGVITFTNPANTWSGDLIFVSDGVAKFQYDVVGDSLIFGSSSPLGELDLDGNDITFNKLYIGGQAIDLGVYTAADFDQISGAGTLTILNTDLTDGILIQSFEQSGRITWTNTLEGVFDYQVEWASSPGGPWTNSWDHLTGILTAGGSGSANVPYFYRVVGTATAMPTNGIVAYYPMNGDAADESDAANHGTMYGPTTTEDRFGNPGGALAFNGVSDYIEVPYSEDISFGDVDFTVLFWIKVSESQIPSGSNIDNSIMEKWEGGTEGYPFVFRMRNELVEASSPGLENTVGTARYGGAAVGASSVGTTNSLMDARWHQLALVKRGDSLELYQDTELQGTVVDTVGDDAINTAHLVIGRRDELRGQYFKGALDSLMIYDRALSAEELRLLLRLDSEM
jgi:hypothetical protein